MEQSNQSYLKIQDEMKALRAKQESSFKAREKFIARLLNKSSEVRNSILAIDDKKHGSATS